MKILSYFILLSCFWAFSGCATIPSEEVPVIQESSISESPVLSSAAVQTKSLKRNVAIARFTNETKYGQGFFSDKNGDRIGKQASDILSARLGATEKFILLERSDIAKIDKELNIGGLASLNICADYLILGSVSEFGRREVSNVGVFSRKKQQAAYAKVNIRLVDVKTGQIVFSEEGEGEALVETSTVMGLGARAGYDSSLNDKAISAAISKMVNDIVENLLDKPWRSYVLSDDDGTYIISGGKSQGINIGDEFIVFLKGKTVKNPQTGMMIELPGKELGKLNVLQTIGDMPISEVSLCSLVTGNLASANIKDLYIGVADEK